MDDFYGKVAEIMEVDELKASDVLEAFPEWDSLSRLSVIAMVGAKYGVNLTAADLRRATTAQGLFDLVAQKSAK
jgi:acyl carrier protein